MKSGIYTLSFEKYEADDGVNKSLLDSLAITPLHCWSKWKNPFRIPSKPTPAQVLGNAIHTSILEPERFEEEYCQEPNIKDYPGSLDSAEDYKAAAKERGLKATGTKAVLKSALLASGLLSTSFWDEKVLELTQGRTSLSETDWHVITGIRNRVRKNPTLIEILKYGQAEQSIFWTDEDTGINCKGRLDWLHSDGHGRVLILDLKSTRDASLEGFQRAISKYRYHVQAAFYIDGLKKLGYDASNFIFGAWEKFNPYACALYYVSDSMLEAGRAEYKRLLKIYKKCLETDNWPGYSQEVLEINLPANHKEISPESELESDWFSEMEGNI